MRMFETRTTDIYLDHYQCIEEVGKIYGYFETSYIPEYLEFLHFVQ